MIGLIGIIIVLSLCAISYNIGKNQSKHDNMNKYVFRIFETRALWEFTKFGCPIEILQEEMDEVMNLFGLLSSRMTNDGLDNYPTFSYSIRPLDSDDNNAYVSPGAQLEDTDKDSQNIIVTFAMKKSFKYAFNQDENQSSKTV